MVARSSRMPAAAFRALQGKGSHPERTLALLLQDRGIPFTREVRFHATRMWRLDFVVAEIFAVEIEGGGFVGGRHSRGAGIENDCEKTCAAFLEGIPTIRVTPDQIRRGEAIRWIQRALEVWRHP